MPVYSEASISNMACGLLGITARIDDYANEISIEAINARLYFPHIRELLLETCPWQFATKRAELALSVATPWDGWSFCYIYPVDCKLAVKIVNPCDPTGSLGLPPIPFKVIDLPGDYGKAILCNTENAVLEYNQSITDVNKFSSSFVQAFMMGMAAHLGMPLRVSADIQANAQSNFGSWLANAVNFEQRQQRDDVMPESELVRGRF